MHTLDETSCAKGKPLRSLWTADEARMVKHILNNLTVKQWNLPSTEVERDLSGDWTIWIPEGGSGGTSAYRSYFRVINASTTDPAACKIGVTDGGWLGSGSPTNCGVVKVNDALVEVPVFTGYVLTAAGTYYVWLHSYMDAEDGESAAIIVGAQGSTARPANPYGSVAYGSQLLGRVTVIDTGGVLSISAINQDYLSGGEHLELLYGKCP